MRKATCTNMRRSLMGIVINNIACACSDQVPEIPVNLTGLIFLASLLLLYKALKKAPVPAIYR